MRLAADHQGAQDIVGQADDDQAPDGEEDRRSVAALIEQPDYRGNPDDGRPDEGDEGEHRCVTVVTVSIYECF